MVVVYGIVAALLTIPTVSLWGSSTTAQDTTETRLADLETRVAEQGEAITRLGRQAAGLRERIDLLEPAPDAAVVPDAGQASEPVGGGVDLRFEGSSDTVTDPFIVGPGTVRFDAVYNGSSNFAVWIYGPDGTQDLVFNEIGPYEGSQVVPVAATGEFAIGLTAGEAFLEVTGSDGSWRIDVSQ